MNVLNIEQVGRKLSARCNLAMSSEAGDPHVFSVRPAWEGATIWVTMAATSAARRDIDANARAALQWETSDAGDGLVVWGTASMHHDPDGSSSPHITLLSIKPDRALHTLANGDVLRWKEPAQ